MLTHFSHLKLMISASNLRFSLLLLTATLTIVGCSTTPMDPQYSSGIKPFATDGCSLFPDGTIEDTTKWQECCITHDKAYWQGGTEDQRRSADLELKDCILEETGDSVLANLVFDGVRGGGSPIFPTWYRWGYGWPYERQYQNLSELELLDVKQQLQEYDIKQKSMGLE